jgi:hypothetical protein
LATSILASEAPFAYLNAPLGLVEIHVPFVDVTSAPIALTQTYFGGLNRRALAMLFLARSLRLHRAARTTRDEATADEQTTLYEQLAEHILRWAGEQVIGRRPRVS